MNEKYISVKLLSEVIFFFLIIGDIFIFQTNSDVWVLILLSLWVLGSVKWKIHYQSTMRLALVFLALVLLLYFIGRPQQIIERTALWAYIFFFMGTIQNIFAIWTLKK